MVHYEAVYEVRDGKRGIEGVLLYRGKVVAKVPVKKRTSLGYEVRRAFELAELLGYYLVLFRVSAELLLDVEGSDFLSSFGVDVEFLR